LAASNLRTMVNVLNRGGHLSIRGNRVVSGGVERNSNRNGKPNNRRVDAQSQVNNDNIGNSNGGANSVNSNSNSSFQRGGGPHGNQTGGQRGRNQGQGRGSRGYGQGRNGWRGRGGRR